MFFSILFSQSKCGWWDFQLTEFAEKEANSLQVPIFALCTSPTCPHCVGLPAKFHEYADQSKINAIFTHFDCSKNYLCSRAGIRGVPSFVLIRGSVAKYWKITGERSSDGWNHFLAEELQANLIETAQTEDIVSYLPRIHGGSSAFHLLCSRDDKELLKSYKHAASTLGPYGCTFTFSHSPGNMPVLTAFLSNTCNVSASVPKIDISAFLSKYKLSYYHQFDLSEFKDAAKKGPIFVTASEGSMMQQHKSAVDRFSAKYCDKIQFGWTDTSRNNDLVQYAGMKKEDAPFHIAMNKRKSCLIASKDRTLDADRDGTIQSLLKGGNCSGKNPLKGAVKKAPVGLISGVVISLVIFTALFVFWDFIRPSSQKRE